jgi:hypothetical protein
LLSPPPGPGAPAAPGAPARPPRGCRGNGAGPGTVRCCRPPSARRDGRDAAPAAAAAGGAAPAESATRSSTPASLIASSWASCSLPPRCSRQGRARANQGSSERPGRSKQARRASASISRFSAAHRRFTARVAPESGARTAPRAGRSRLTRLTSCRLIRNSSGNSSRLAGVVRRPTASALGVTRKRCGRPIRVSSTEATSGSRKIQR